MSGQMVEIRWHARGGQGAKTAAMFLAEAVLTKGKFGQGFPEYGPERRGAPVRGFTRIADAPIRRHCGIDNPKIVMRFSDVTGLILGVHARTGLVTFHGPMGGSSTGVSSSTASAASRRRAYRMA